MTILELIQLVQMGNTLQEQYKIAERKTKAAHNEDYKAALEFEMERIMKILNEEVPK